MESGVEIIEQTLVERGVDAKVLHNSRGIANDDYIDSFIIRKELADGVISYKIAVSDTSPNSEHAEHRLTVEAQNAANEIQEKTTDSYSWGSYSWGNKKSVIVSEYDGGWAECQLCGAVVETPVDEQFVNNSSEMSTPTPTMRNMKHELSNMSEFQKNVFKLYLIGKLSHTCDVTAKSADRNI